MATYEGIPVRTTQGGMLVLKDGIPLDPSKSQAMVNHNPEGFNWGYNGSGPAQLALALLLEETDIETAHILYQKFKWDIMSTAPRTWVLTSEMIGDWIVENKKAIERRSI